MLAAEPPAAREGRGCRGVNSLFMETESLPRSTKFFTLLHSDPNISSTAHIGAVLTDDGDYTRNSSASVGGHGYLYSDRNAMSSSTDSSPYVSPWTNPVTSSPYSRSPWTRGTQPVVPFNDDSATFSPSSSTGLIGSLVREEGHIYSLAAAGDLLYTGSDSKNIRVWKNQEEFAGFKSNSGLVKAIVIAAERIFTGHQDGKIRVWRVSRRSPTSYRRAGTLPTFRDMLKSSIRPSNYVEVRRNRNALWLRHSDAVSCLSLNRELGLLYSGSWDKTFKVWRIADSKCLESVRAHDDAVNAVVVGFDGLVFTGSADGAVKVWRGELLGKASKHTHVQTLLKQDSAVTALAVNAATAVVYCGSSDGHVNFWERKKHLTHGGVLRGHKQAVLCMAAAGSLVLSGSADKTICIWRRDAADGIHTCLSVLDGHDGPVKCLAVERDRESRPAAPRWIVYSGSLDKSVKVWRVSELPAGYEEDAVAKRSSVAGRDAYGCAAGVGTANGGGARASRY